MFDLSVKAPNNTVLCSKTLKLEPSRIIDVNVCMVASIEIWVSFCNRHDWIKNFLNYLDQFSYCLTWLIALVDHYRRQHDFLLDCGGIGGAYRATDPLPIKSGTASLEGGEGRSSRPCNHLRSFRFHGRSWLQIEKLSSRNHYSLVHFFISK